MDLHLPAGVRRAGRPRQLLAFRGDVMRCVGLIALTVAFGVMICGCGGGAKGGKITGSVKLNGNPLPDAKVHFYPSEDQNLRPNSAVTDASGKFEIKPDPRTGQTLMPGKYNVMINKLVKKDGTVPTGEDAAMDEASGILKNIVPSKYNDPEAKPAITVTINPGDNEVAPFELKSK